MLIHPFALMLKGNITGPSNLIAVIYKYFVVTGQVILTHNNCERSKIIHPMSAEIKTKSLNHEIRSHGPIYKYFEVKSLIKLTHNVKEVCSYTQ